MVFECPGMVFECAGMVFECAGMVSECAGMVSDVAGMVFEYAGKYLGQMFGTVNAGYPVPRYADFFPSEILRISENPTPATRFRPPLRDRGRFSPDLRFSGFREIRPPLRGPDPRYAAGKNPLPDL